MNNQPYNQIRQEQGPEAIITLRPKVIDMAVRNTETAHTSSHVIKGMETPIFKNIYEQFLASNALQTTAGPNAEVVSRFRLDLSPLSPMRFARRLVGAAFAVLPSSATSAASEVVATTTLTVPGESTVTMKPEGATFTTPIETDTAATLSVVPVEISSGELNIDNIRAQIAAMTSNSSGE